MRLTKKQIAYAMELQTTGLTLHRITAKLNLSGANITLLQLNKELAAATEFGFAAWEKPMTTLQEISTCAKTNWEFWTNEARASLAFYRKHKTSVYKFSFRINMKNRRERKFLDMPGEVYRHEHTERPDKLSTRTNIPAVASTVVNAATGERKHLNERAL